MEQPVDFKGDSARYFLSDKKNFESIKNYSNWLMTHELYKAFYMYKKILICQADVLIIEDQIKYWVDKDYDYIGAPWHGLLKIKPNYNSTLNYNGNEYALFVGNGGFSMRDTSGICNALERNSNFFNEFLENKDGAFSFVGLIDPLFKLAPYHDACLFSLELLAFETIKKTKKMPMGFHALEKHDGKFWRNLMISLQN
jgi:hypothetical protein